MSFRKLTQMMMSTTVTADEVKVSIRPFKWKNTIHAPAQAQCVKIGFCCVFADFNRSSYTALRANDLEIVRGKDFPGGRFKIAIPKEEELAVLLMMNIYFESDLGSRVYRIENKKFQAGVILDAVHIKNGEVVEFVAEDLPKIEEEPPKAPDAFWTLGWEEEEEDG